ncbi:tubulin polymerization-promoting protein family member 2-like [Bolinopsis microptera]|uniref:tubulin polymerization-promoting protein family member 2-like n=1 Tax=Bolinopsis microptera TaxID=2820187 RepID=UPI0030792CA1
MEETFANFSKFGDTKSTGKELDNQKFSKLCKDSGIMGKLVTSTDVDIIFSKYKPKGGRTITLKEFNLILDDLCVKRFPKKETLDEKKEAIRTLIAGKGPTTKGTTKVSTKGVTDRLTDTSRYTGSHKERFGTDGKGKGLKGTREDTLEYDGYVVGYKNKDTYGEAH